MEATGWLEMSFHRRSIGKHKAKWRLFIRWIKSKYRVCVYLDLNTRALIESKITPNSSRSKRIIEAENAKK